MSVLLSTLAIAIGLCWEFLMLLTARIAEMLTFEEHCEQRLLYVATRPSRGPLALAEPKPIPDF